jgi:hypothetical protein
MTIPLDTVLPVLIVINHLPSKSRMVYFFIYVVAYLPSSYTELSIRQRLMLKISYMILQKIVLL